MVEPVVSRLDDEAKLRAHVLSLVAMKEGASPSDILETFNRTLASIQLGFRFIRSMIPRILRFLEKGGFVSTSGGGRIHATALGKRVSQLYIDPASALLMVEVLSSPRLRSSSTLEILHFLSLLPEMYKVPLRRRDLDVVEGILDEMSPLLEPDDLEDPSDYVRAVKMALVLRAWIEEVREAEIEAEFGVEPGDMRRYSDVAAWLCYSFSEIARLLGFWERAEMLRRLHVRLRHGIREELIPLIALEEVGRRRARVLYEAGFRSVEAVALADPADLEALPGIGRTLAVKIISSARRTLGMSDADSPDRVPLRLSRDEGDILPGE